MDTPWRIALSIFAATVLTPIITRVLSRALPPRQSDTVEADSVTQRYRSLELWSQLAAGIGVVGAIAFLILLRVGNTHLAPRRSFRLACTRCDLIHRDVHTSAWPLTLARVRRFYELYYGITRRFLVPLYATLCVFGLLSTAVLLSRV